MDWDLPIRRGIREMNRVLRVESMIFFGDEIIVLKCRKLVCWNASLLQLILYSLQAHSQIHLSTTCGLSAVNETGRLELGDDGEIKKRC